MDFQLKDVLGAIGPNASMIFASWIFMTFLESRYSNAYNRYRMLIDSYRDGLDGKRKDIIREEIRVYRQRIDTMRQATNLGMYAAIMLISSLIVGALDAMFGSPALMKYLGTVLAIGGLLLVIWSATKVVHENTLIRQAIGGEVKDIPELADDAGERRA
jgi:uncharacterized membrane protein